MPANFDVSDWIQVATTVVLAVTLVIVTIQVRIQNRLSKAQILRDRFEMYWRTYDPVTDGEVSSLHLYPPDYMDIRKYEDHYKTDERSLKRYIGFSKLYEYLAFSFTLRNMGVPDPLGPKWIDLWASDLLDSQEFKDVDAYYKDYYPDFHKFLDDMEAARDRTPARGEPRS